MSLIKSLIQRLLDSRTTPAQAGHNAMPSSTPTTISTLASITSWGTITTFTAPDDGYVTFHGRSMAAAAAQIASLPLENNPTVITATQDIYQEMSCNLPVVKGKTIEVYGSNIEYIVVSFNRLIGGGYNSLVRRALSCLKPSFNFSPKVSSKAKNLGFQNNQLLLSIRALIFLAQAPRISLPTPHRATAGRLLGAIQLQSQLLKSKSRTGRWHLLPYLTETLRELESVVTLKKGHRLSSCAVAEVQPIILFGSTKQVQTFNPLTGGALC